MENGIVMDVRIEKGTTTSGTSQKGRVRERTTDSAGSAEVLLCPSLTLPARRGRGFWTYPLSPIAY
jgi:hypothetical protein